jgi:hypothetical protein
MWALIRKCAERLRAIIWPDCEAPDLSGTSVLADIRNRPWSVPID